MSEIIHSQEEFEANAWELEETTETLSIEEISEIAKTGISYCEGSCSSRNWVGQDRCKCVRERFPTPSHYQLYLKCREHFQRMLDLEIMAIGAKDTMEDKNV